VLAGVLMIAVTYLVPYLGGAVDAYLTIISIMDMPLFVIAIPYGLLWKRATWQGAMAAYLAGSAAGAVLRFGFGMDVAPVTIISGVVAALVCPVVSLLTTGARPIPEPEGPPLQKTRPTFAARASLYVLGIGFLLVIGGILMASQAAPQASAVALTGLAIFFAGGLWRAMSLR
jgi:SSS family solute:Na+ symporter